MNRLLERLQYAFKNHDLYLLALTHKSYTNENPEEAPQHNERLEFLGDAVLDFLVSDLLMAQYPTAPEGVLSKMRASLVSEAALAEVALELDLGACLRMGRGEETSGGREKDSILSDALEALIAAIYLDSVESEGVTAINRVILDLFLKRAATPVNSPGLIDYKTELQEFMQKRHKDSVRYEIMQEEGPDHSKVFEAAVIFRNQELGRGSGKSKKQAEQAAARKGLEAARTEGVADD